MARRATVSVCIQPPGQLSLTSLRGHQLKIVPVEMGDRVRKVAGKLLSNRPHHVVCSLLAQDY